ncbi:MAG: hypothetical protein LUC93_17980 [Planctomycetaceae bacterium]|nr:hypothetical protein [Planctomycetaceae bacterium]
MSEVVVLNSITDVTPDHAGMGAVTGSNGGMFCAHAAGGGLLRGAVFNDAGVGLHGAGVASLAFCDAYQLPVFTVAHTSSRIGDGNDTMARGIVSRVNRAAASVGVTVGMPCREAAPLLLTATPIPGEPSQPAAFRHEMKVPGKSEAVVCIDSAALAKPTDADGVIVTGSHGGVIGGKVAVYVPARFFAYNDAGFGMEDAGAAGLGPLAEQGIAAVVVSHETAEIGNAKSTYETGVISRVNSVAEAAGFQCGVPLATALIPYLR